MAADLDANIWGVVGASGTGKGLWIKQHLVQTKPPRLVVWDFKREYTDLARLAPSLASVRAAMLKAGADGPLRIGYCPVGAGEKALRREFEALCELVYCTFIAEELANVTTPGWASASWRKMTTSGRHAGVHIIGATQTPALVDKTFLGNCTRIHACAMREFAHRVAVARSMDIDEGRIAALVKFQWIEKDFDSGEVTTGWVPVPGRKAATGRGASSTPSGTARPCQRGSDAATVAPIKPAPKGSSPPRKPK